MLAVLQMIACGGSADVQTVAPSGLQSSWVADLAAHPEKFETEIAAAKPGWIALHRNDWIEATRAAPDAAPGKRASAELATFHKVLAEISTDAWRSLGDTWEHRGTLPTDSALPTLVATAVREAGDEAAASRWEKMPARADASIDARKDAHAAVRAGGDPEPLRALAAKPLVSEAYAGGTRLLWDPRVHASLSLGYAAHGGALEGLDAALFSGRVTAADPDVAASLSLLGLALPATDDTEACREVVRGLDRQLDPWKGQLAASAPPEGQALLRDLRLVEGLRARLLVNSGATALMRGMPGCALAFADLALDHESPRAVNPINSPTLFAVLAAANLRTGHTREALDALEVLVTPFPEVAGLDETVGDLAVLQGLDRTGDSREN